jgi:DNA-binding MarR family transcriptional regulator
MTAVSESPYIASNSLSQVPSSEDCIELLVEVLPRVARVFKAQTRASKLSAQHIFLMMCIDDASRTSEDGAQPSDLARRACLSSAAITGALDDLVEGDLCVRAHSEKDRRKVLVHLTSAGRQVLADMRVNVRKSLRGLMDDWSDERRLRLYQVLWDLDGMAARLVSLPQAGCERNSSS